MPNPYMPIVLLDHSYHEQGREERKLHNINEASLVKKLIEALIERGWRDIGIVAPYAEQVQTLQEKCAGIAGLDIGTIDKYQGREKQDIVYSAVRGNFKDEIGFLQDQRRLNVALTQAVHYS